LAPAARHVHVPSLRLLVSSMSILRDIGPQSYRLTDRGSETFTADPDLDPDRRKY
jgi:hypothetical protein